MMAKTIKFNLICDNHPVRTIEDLQENFSVEDILEYYHNGLLLRWLNVRGYNVEYEKVSKIKEKYNLPESDQRNADLDIIKELIEIFCVETDSKMIEENIYIIQFLKEREKVYKIYKENHFEVNKIIEDYQSGYEKIVNEIINNPTNEAKIKACIAEMVKNYHWIMDLVHKDLFWQLRKKSVLAIACLLMNEECRDYYLPAPKENMCATENSIEKNNIFEEIRSMFANPETRAELRNYTKQFLGATNGYWKDVELKGKKYMVISMDKDAAIRSGDNQDESLTFAQINDKFIILDGIDYKCASGLGQLIYMEV